MSRPPNDYGFVIKQPGSHKMAEFPKKAKVVIIGLGGIVGASVAHHLIERG
ncbi:FAD dependent oxidoreductase [Brucella melitensis]|nr:dimethylglycine dehydrogenase [Brucella melitensis M28]